MSRSSREYACKRCNNHYIITYDNPRSIQVHKYFTKWETFRFAWPGWNLSGLESRKVKVELDLSLLRDKFSLGYEWSGAWLYTRITVSMYLYRWKQTSYNSRANYSLACLSSETHNVQHIFHPGGRVLPYIGYIGMCGAQGYVFVAVLVWNRVLISTIVVWNRAWFVPFSLQLGMFLEETTSSSFGDKTISLLMFTPTVYVP